MNLKGGVGKTTTAIALATCAARDGLDVEVLDADQQASAFNWAAEAEEEGDALPFAVTPANMGSIAYTAKRLKSSPDKWVFIDCPPGDKIVNAAQEAADMIVVPTSDGHADLAKTLEAVASFEAAGNAYAILFTKVAKNTNAFAWAMEDVTTQGLSYFDQTIPRREALKNTCGFAFGKELFGYERVWEEIKAGLEED